MARLASGRFGQGSLVSQGQTELVDVGAKAEQLAQALQVIMRAIPVLRGIEIIVALMTRQARGAFEGQVFPLEIIIELLKKRGQLPQILRENCLKGGHGKLQSNFRKAIVACSGECENTKKVP